MSNNDGILRRCEKLQSPVCRSRVFPSSALQIGHRLSVSNRTRAAAKRSDDRGKHTTADTPLSRAFP